MPALGCGLGGLEWRDVFALIQDTAENLPDKIELIVFPPR